MASIIFAVLLLASNVACFRQKVDASGNVGHLRALETSEHTLKLSREAPAEEEDDDQCPDSKMPKNSKGFWTYHQEMEKEKAANKEGDEAENTKLFFACLHDAKDYSLFFNVRHLLETNTEDEPKKYEKDGWVTYSYGSGKRYFIATIKDEKKELVRSVVTLENDVFTTYEGNESQQGVPEIKTCPKWSKNGDLCELYEVSQDDLVCVEGAEAFDDKKCSERVANTMVFLGSAEDLGTEDGPTGKEFTDVDAENTAYCGFGGLMDDFIDNDTPLLAKDSGATSMQCLMVSCAQAEGKVPYDYWYKCRFSMNKVTSFPIVLAWLLFWFLLMGVIADGYLVPALVKIGRGLNMSDALLGATLLALGGAANDFMVGIASALKDVKLANKADPDEDRDLDTLKMWLGGVFGTGFFINTLVAALVMIFAPPEGIPVIPGVITRDICFRMVAVTTMLTFAWFGAIKWYTASLMILMYLVYVFLTLQDANKRKATNESENNETEAGGVPSQGGSAARLSRGSAASFTLHGKLDTVAAAPNSDDAAVSFAGEEALGDRIKRHMGYDPEGGVMDKAGFVAALPIRWAFALTMATNTWDPVVSPLMPLCICIFIPISSFGLMVAITDNEDMMNDVFNTELACFAAVGLVLSGLVFFCQMRAGPKGSTTYIAPMTYAWVTFVTCVLWLALIANEVLDCLGCIAGMFDVPQMVAGMTMLAWGNCVDNVFATIGLAKAGEFGVAITGIYAAPMFNVLFGTGITLLIITVMKNDHNCDFPMDNSAVIMLCTLVIILACTLGFTMLNGWRMTRKLGAVLAMLYPTVLIVAFVMGPKFSNYSPLEG